MKFSERKGYTKARLELQREEIDVVLKNKLWSALKEEVFNYIREFHTNQGYWDKKSDVFIFIKKFWVEFFVQPIDTLPSEFYKFDGMIREWFFKTNWYITYDLFEFILSHFTKTHIADKLRSELNRYLEQEKAAYRFVGSVATEITDDIEIAEIESIFTLKDDFTNIKKHFQTALILMNDRSNPDYRNSIKESISAVEAICRHIINDEKASLGAALKKLKDQGLSIHASLEKSWGSMYGYTSDEAGIRHALNSEETITFAEAKYMLVACAAFVNYLLQVSQK